MATTGADARGAVTLVDDVQGLDRVADVWDSMDSLGVDADREYFRAVIAGSPGVVRPHVVHTRTDGGDTLLVARVARQRFALGLPNRLQRDISAKALIVSFDGIASDHPAGDALALGQLRMPLDHGAVDVTLLQKVDTASRWFEHLTDHTPAREILVRPSVAWWFTDLPDSWDALLAARTAKSRRQIRYDDNKVRKTLGSRLELRRLHLPAEQHRIEPEVRAVAASSYQSGLGVSVFDNPVQASLMRSAREHGWLRLWMTYVDGVPAAFWWGVVRRGTLSIGSPGFDPRFARERLGYYTLRRLLEDSCADPEIQTIDYGPGDSDYKARFGTRRRTAADVLVFGPRWRARALRTALQNQDRFVEGARLAAERLGRADEIRDRLRRSKPRSPR